MAQPNELEVSALNALAASPDGMTLSDISSHLETRFGSTDEASKSAQSSESKGFQDSVMRLLSSDPGSGGLVERGLATVDETGGLIRITDAGRLIVRP